MKILYFVSYFPPISGAAAINTYKIVEFLIKYGHEVMVLAPRVMGKNVRLRTSKELIKSSNFRIISSSFPINYPFNLVLSHYENVAKVLLKIKAEFSPDLILSQYHAYHYASVAGSFLSKKLNVPHVIRSHDIFLDSKNLSFTNKIFNSITYPSIFKSISSSEIFYVVCSELKTFLLQLNKFNNVDFRVHHNGIDTKIFFPKENQDELKNEYGCDKILIFSGSLIPDIGLQDFIPLLSNILKNHRDTHVIFLGVGPCKNYIRNYLKEKKIEKQVHLLGQKSHNEIPYYINNSDIGIGRITHNKIWKYSIPVKCLEYMACKKPFISTPISKDIIGNENVGLILKRNFTKKEVIDYFSMLIEDKKLRSKLGQNGLNKINKDFRWEEIMEEFNNDITNLENRVVS